MIIVGIFLEGDVFQIVGVDSLQTTLFTKHVPFLDSSLPIHIPHIISECIPDQDYLIATSLEASELFIANMQSSLKSKRAVLKTLPFQVENLIPKRLDNLEVFPKIEKVNGSFNIDLFVINQDSVDKHLQFFEKFGINPHLIYSQEGAFASFGKRYFSKSESFLSFYLGFSKTIVTSYIDNRFSTSYEIDIGLNDFLKYVPGNSLDEKKELLQECLLNEIDSKSFTDFIDTYLKKLDRIFSDYIRKKQDLDRFNMICMGYCSSIKGLQEYLESKFASKIQILESESSKEELQFAPAIGLCLSALQAKEIAPQFREKEKIHSYYIKKISQKIGATIGCALLLFGVTFFGLQHVVNTKRDILRLEIAKFTKNYPSIFEEKELSLEEIQAKLTRVKEYKPYFSSPILASDMLDYLSTHPILNKENTHFEIHDFKYLLVSYPSLKKPNDKYRVKLQISFHADSPTHAKEFYDYLLKEDPNVDSKQEISFNRSDHGYQVAFFLKG